MYLAVEKNKIIVKCYMLAIFSNKLYFNKKIYYTVLQQLSSRAYVIKGRYKLFKQENVKRNSLQNGGEHANLAISNNGNVGIGSVADCRGDKSSLTLNEWKVQSERSLGVNAVFE